MIKCHECRLILLTEPVLLFSGVYIVLAFSSDFQDGFQINIIDQFNCWEQHVLTLCIQSVAKHLV